MVRGKFKSKPTGRRLFSTPEEMAAGTSSRPRTFRKLESEKEELEEEEEVESEEDSEEDSEEVTEKKKGTEGLIEVQNPNLLKPKALKAKDANFEKTSELSRREREEIEKQKAHERYMRQQEQGKTEQARKDLERLALIRQQRADAAKKRDEEKAGIKERSTLDSLIAILLEEFDEETLILYEKLKSMITCINWRSLFDPLTATLLEELDEETLLLYAMLLGNMFSPRRDKSKRKSRKRRKLASDQR